MAAQVTIMTQNIAESCTSCHSQP